MDLDKSNPSNLDLDLDWIWTGFGLDFVLGLDWILDSKYFMDLDLDFLFKRLQIHAALVFTTKFQKKFCIF